MLKYASSQGRYVRPVRSHRDRGVGSANPSVELGASLLRTSGTPVTNRAGGGTTALQCLERRARSLDPALPGRWVHAARDPCPRDGLEPTEPPVGPSCESEAARARYAHSASEAREGAGPARPRLSASQPRRVPELPRDAQGVSRFTGAT